MAERPEDLNLPTAIVTKMIKDCLPTNCKVSKEANVAIAKVSKLYYENKHLLITNLGSKCICSVCNILCQRSGQGKQQEDHHWGRCDHCHRGYGV